MKVIVTGATSFIGTAAVRLLLHQGHQVCGVVRPGSKNLSHLWEAVPEAARERLAVAELEQMSGFTSAGTELEAITG